MVNAIPLTGETMIDTLHPVVGDGAAGAADHVEMRVADPDYLRTMHMPLISGRWFREGDREDGTVVNQRLASRFWPGDNPIGRRLQEGDNPPFTVIGVVGDVRDATLEREPGNQCYRSAAADVWGGMTFVVRTRIAPLSVLPELRKALLQVDPEQPLAHVRTMREIADATTLPRRFETWLLASFAATALFLAALGVFGALSLSVARRKREFGIRMAMGATTHRVLRLVLGEASLVLAAGVAAGLVLAMLSVRFVASLLYGVGATDPRVYLVSVVVLVAAGAVACWLPAHRAARTDPAVVLREE
jgi:predicted permease